MAASAARPASVGASRASAASRSNAEQLAVREDAEEVGHRLRLAPGTRLGGSRKCSAEPEVCHGRDQ